MKIIVYLVQRLALHTFDVKNYNKKIYIFLLITTPITLIQSDGKTRAESITGKLI